MWLSHSIRRSATPRAAGAGAILAAALIAATASADDPLAAREEAALRAAAERAADSVVQIRTIGGLDTVGRTLLPDGPTTGLVISADGYIVSSAFNFAQQPASILVTFATGKQVPAELVAADHSRMIVLLKAAGVADLAVPEFVPADEIRVGQWAVAVGRTFRADRTNVSVGIVSAVNRMFGKVLQTDADVSVANYGGPLVDLRGRVLGVIVPIAPQGTSEVAGVEWYDSGIGFAVPLAAIAGRLEQLKKGEDLHAGILGIGLRPSNPHSAPAVLAAVRPDSPAGQAGLKKDDRIVELGGQAIRTQNDLRFALGTRYGGDTVDVVLQRGEERIERTITLASKLPAFHHAFLGILPLRPAGDATNNRGANAMVEVANPQPAGEVDEDQNAMAHDSTDAAEGVAVRMVYAGSPAEASGVQAGDRIRQINGAVVRSLEDAIAEMNNLAPGSEVAVQLVRGDRTIDLSLTAAELPTNVPSELPAAYGASDQVARRRLAAADRESSRDAEPRAAAGAANAAPQPQAGETRELSLPEFRQKCQIYVPAVREAAPPLGALLWLHDGDHTAAEPLIRQWQPICDRDGVLLVVPSAAEAGRWDRTDLEYLGRLVGRVVAQFKIDPRRLVVYGHGSGGGVAWTLAFSSREALRGVAVSAAPLPRRTTVPTNEPGLRLAIFAAIPSAGDVAVSCSAGLQKCADAGYPVSTITLANDSGQLLEAERNTLARWIDALDRF